MAQYLQITGILLTALILIRLWREGLAGRYPAFLSYNAVVLVTGLVLMGIPRNSNGYAPAYAVVSILDWICLFFVLRELSRLLFEDHPGIEAAVRLGIWLSLAAAVLTSVVLLLISPDEPTKAFPLLRAFFFLYQSMMFFLAVLFVGPLVFLAWFPVSLRRNIVVYSFGFSLKFITGAATVLLHNFRPKYAYNEAVSLLHQVLEVAVLMTWLVFLNRAGETPKITVARKWDEAEAQATLRRLDSLNDALSNAIREPRR